jgi:DNA-binding transcriptional regulator LsrR (DeoR family)
MGRINELRLMTKVARMFYSQHLKQAQIADQLDVSQATVSRLLRRAQEEQIVRINISTPTGTYADIESELERQYGLKEAIVVDSTEDNEEQVMRDLGMAAAYYLEQTIKPGEVIGLSSWSKTLMAMVDAMNPLARESGSEVVQILGGVGNPSAENHAVHLVRRLAVLVQGKAFFLPAPGVVASAEMKQLYLQDPYVVEVLKKFPRVTLGLIGIGSVEPSDMIASSGNVFSDQELEELRSRGAVGDACMRFFTAEGEPAQSPMNGRTIGIELEQLRSLRRSVAVAGGKRKVAAIRGALLGRYVNVLITDIQTAQALLSPASTQGAE